jgi:hypothetical protein
MRWAVNCVRSTFNFWGALRADNPGSDSNSSGSLLEEVQRNAATIAELDRMSSSTNDILPSAQSSTASESRSDSSSIFRGGDTYDCSSQQLPDWFSPVSDETSPVETHLSEESGHDRQLDPNDSTRSSTPPRPRSLLLPTLRFSKRASNGSSVSSAIASVSFRAKAMIAEIDSYRVDSADSLQDQSPFRPVPSGEHLSAGSNAASDSGQGSRPRRLQPPLSLEPLNLDDL